MKRKIQPWVWREVDEKEDTILSLKESRWKLKQQDDQNQPNGGKGTAVKHWGQKTEVDSKEKDLGNHSKWTE